MFYNSSSESLILSAYFWQYPAPLPILMYSGKNVVHEVLKRTFDSLLRSSLNLAFRQLKLRHIFVFGMVY